MPGQTHSSDHELLKDRGSGSVPEASLLTRCQHRAGHSAGKGVYLHTARVPVPACTHTGPKL